MQVACKPLVGPFGFGVSLAPLVATQGCSIEASRRVTLNGKIFSVASQGYLAAICIRRSDRRGRSSSDSSPRRGKVLQVQGRHAWRGITILDLAEDPVLSLNPAQACDVLLRKCDATFAANVPGFAKDSAFIHGAWSGTGS